MHLMLEKKLEGGLPDGHPLALWIPRYVAEQANRYKVGADGRTPEERRTGKRWIKPMPVFGEKIFVKPAGKGKKTDVSKMNEARFLGCHNRFGSVLGMTRDGVVVGWLKGKLHLIQGFSTESETSLISQSLSLCPLSSKTVRMICSSNCVLGSDSPPRCKYPMHKAPSRWHQVEVQVQAGPTKQRNLRPLSSGS